MLPAELEKDFVSLQWVHGAFEGSQETVKFITAWLLSVSHCPAQRVQVPFPGEENASAKVCGGEWDSVCLEKDQRDLCQQLGVCRWGGSAFLQRKIGKKSEYPHQQLKKFIYVFYLQVNLTSGLVMSLLAPSRVKRALQGFSIRLWCRIQSILLHVRLKNQKRVYQNLQVDVFLKDLIFSGQITTRYHCIWKLHHCEFPNMLKYL